MCFPGVLCGYLTVGPLQARRVAAAVVAGGGTGGVAAALTAAFRVWLLSPARSRWCWRPPWRSPGAAGRADRSEEARGRRGGVVALGVSCARVQSSAQRQRLARPPNV
jgi:hypothetical protein